MGTLTSKSAGARMLYHSFLLKAWTLQNDVINMEVNRRNTPESHNGLSLIRLKSKRKIDHESTRLVGSSYLHLLFLLSLLFEVSGVLSGSHNLKFRSNNNNLFNSTL